MEAAWLSLGFGLLSALTWGAGDFGGGMASRSARTQTVVLWTSLLGGLLFLALALLGPEPFRPHDLPFALLGGALGALGLYSLYRALSQGSMSLAAPVAGVVGAALPVALGLLWEGWPGPLPALGLGVGLVGVWLASRPEGHASPVGLPWALLAGLGFGGFYVLMDRVEGLLWPAALGKLTAFALVLLLSPPHKGLPRGAVPWVLLAALGDAGGNLFFLLAAQAGRLDMAALASSFYPATTVLLAWLLLGERLGPGRKLGMLTCLLALGFIALG
ncbi:DMT family transporter [Thermus sp.]|uniref:DMT family transporter n=1 Tax=Thermus sp. TaxID=275 RepID=UPI0025D0ECD9|nr:DMT family transporter [Thermus sp.]MCS6867421.1 DMT family transporter [Thermus sp.]MDW8357236.1 DMT family transporter [Thermus sp.]